MDFAAMWRRLPEVVRVGALTLFLFFSYWSVTSVLAYLSNGVYVSRWTSVAFFVGDEFLPNAFYFGVIGIVLGLLLPWLRKVRLSYRLALMTHLILLPAIVITEYVDACGPSATHEWCGVYFVVAYVVVVAPISFILAPLFHDGALWLWGKLSAHARRVATLGFVLLLLSVCAAYLLLLGAKALHLQELQAQCGTPRESAESEFDRAIRALSDACLTESERAEILRKTMRRVYDGELTADERTEFFKTARESLSLYWNRDLILSLAHSIRHAEPRYG